NEGFEPNVELLPNNARIAYNDPLNYADTMRNAAKIKTDWAYLKTPDGTPDRERMKQAIVNAFRAVLLSPRKDLRWNTIHYQDLEGVPAGVTDPDVYWDTLEKKRE